MNTDGQNLRAVAKRIARPEPLARKVARQYALQRCDEQRRHLALLRKMRKVTRN